MRLRILERVAFLGGLATLSANVGWADVSSSPSTTVADKSILDTLSEKATLSYFGIYRGAALQDLGASLQPDPMGNPDATSPQSIENSITVGYKLDKDWTIGAVTHFYYFPVGSPARGVQRFDMLDPLIMVQKDNIYKNGGFSLKGKLLFQLPFTSADSLRDRHLVTAITPTLIANYDVPNTKLSLGLYSYVRGYISGADSPSDAPTYKIYVAPNANYQLTSSLSVTLWVDLVQASRAGGTGFISGLNNGIVDIEPGINWDISKNFSINPVLNIYPSNPTLAATSLQAFIVAKAF